MLAPQQDEADDHAAWVEAGWPGGGWYAQGVRTAARTALGAASIELRPAVFQNTLAEALGYALRAGEGDNPENVVEFWREIAARSGLLDELGAEGVEPLIVSATLIHARPLDQPTDAPAEPPPPRSEADYGQSALQIRVADAAEPPAPITFIDPTAWENQSVPPRRWLVHQRIPAGNVTLLNGDGAAGKTTIALQLAVATLKGPDWLGAVVETTGPVIFFSAEEDGDEIHRRIDAIVQHNGMSYGDLAGLHLHCIPGQDAVLGQPDRNGIIRPTPLFERIEAAARDIDPVLIIIEAAADVFAGNENDRAQVRQFIGLLRRLARSDGPAVLLLAHPSLSGLASGSGTSGSTAWNNSVRSRLYFTTPRSKASGEDEPEPDVRQLQVMKANYGPSGEAVKLRWQRGVFVPAGSASTLERVAAEAAIDHAFLQCLDAKGAQGIAVVHTKGRGFAPAVFEAMPEAQGFKSKALAMAMERLLAAGRIKSINEGSPSRPRNRLVRAEIEEPAT